MQQSVTCAYYVIHAKGKTGNNVFIQHPNMSNIVNCQIDQYGVLLIPNKWSIKLEHASNFNVFECHTVLTKLFCLCKV
jgi:hypothetical protein